eukprot:Nitzschia sp. Nitz4//scaffold2_size372955//31330//34835//NITZ4_000361-RA/size372955-augustus-gene-0.353-mRNA-1//1//CDS//3329546590//7839//frame0
MTKQKQLSGWLTVKKRGRDDAQIARDSRKAVSARKKPTKPKKVESDESDFVEEDDDSINDFVVDDDEDVDEEFSSSDDEELIVDESPPRKPLSAKQNGKTRTKASKPTVLELSSDDESASFLQPQKPRLSKPSQPLRRAQDSLAKQRLPALASFAQPKPSRPSKTAKHVLDDSDELSSPSPVKRNKRSDKPTTSTFSKYFSAPALKANKGYNKAVTLSSETSDDEQPARKPNAAKASSKPNRMKSSDSLLSTSNAPKTGNNMFSRFQNPLLDDSDDDSISDMLPSSRSKGKSDNDVSSSVKTSVNKAPLMELDDSSVDADEEIAIKKAIKASRKEFQKSQSSKRGENTYKSKSSTTKSLDPVDADDEVGPIADETLLAETSDEEPEDRGEEYDEEHKTATSVLHTAESLSAHVLQRMKEWSYQEESAAQGMIVNGALSLGSVQPVGKTAAGGNHEWITDALMQKVCPGVKLSNYQLIGVNWMALLHGMKCDLEGKATPVNGVLADEMGLVRIVLFLGGVPCTFVLTRCILQGKTVQTIAFLAWLKYHRSQKVVDVEKPQDNGTSKPHLIAVPVSVLPNWMREFSTFAPELNVVKYHGSLAEREEIQDTLRDYLPRVVGGKPRKNSLDVILAPVTYFQKEKSDDRRFLNKFKFDYLVVDEAHMLKNSQSLRYRMLDRVSTQHRLLLTGTPVQNSPQELLNMLCFIMPLFSKGTDSMDEESSGNKGERMLQHFVDAEKEQDGDEKVAYQKLKHLFAPFVLRRKKEDVIMQLLPPKERIVEHVKLDPVARSIYDSILANHINSNGSKITAAIGDHLFTNLRKAAHHPLLLRGRHNTEAEKRHLIKCFHQFGAFQGEGSTEARVAEEVSKFNDFDIHLTALDLIESNEHRRSELERYVLDEAALFSSAKFAKLRTLLPRLISDGHRVLIFSGWTSCLDLLGCLMENLGLEYLRMDGSSASDARQEMIDQFNQNDSISVFLLSTRACGLGINLTAADTCIIHDLDFNPFNDLQAEDRCHRIGQKRKVTVYKLVAEDTVDADIYNMQERKSKMNAAIMESNAAKNAKKEMLQSAVKNFMSSPPLNRKVKKGADKENEDIICIL